VNRRSRRWQLCTCGSYLWQLLVAGGGKVSYPLSIACFTVVLRKILLR